MKNKNHRAPTKNLVEFEFPQIAFGPNAPYGGEEIDR